MSDLSMLQRAHPDSDGHVRVYRRRDPSHTVVWRILRAEPRANTRHRSPRLTSRLTEVVLPLPSARLIVPVLTRTI